ncbi:MAG TPA: SDR family oxidoreductase [Steroidobacteraceae bacterium]|nr:SDR family oxidoreductase [Steroidobacteraceae bacterium]
MSNELSGKIAIITGGANGLGRGTVELFVAEGAKVVIADMDEKRGSELAARLGNSARFKTTDVSQREQVQAVVDFAVVEFGGLHIMFNNAGVSDNHFGSVLDDGFSSFDRVMRINVLGAMLGTQIAARHMAKNGGGSIINTSSISGIRPGHGFFIYRASKSGIINFSQSAAIDLGQHLIRVNCICPGNIQTEMGTYAAGEPGMTQADVERIQSAVREVRMTRQPLKRQGSPNDIAQAALYFASDRSLQTTGQVMAVDGGATTGDPRSLIKEILDARASAMKR